MKVVISWVGVRDRILVFLLKSASSSSEYSSFNSPTVVGYEARVSSLRKPPELIDLDALRLLPA